MLTTEILSNGNLKIIADEETREEIAEGLKRSFWGTFAEIFEDYSCNGSYTPFDAGEANPFVGLTTAPCIAESMRYPDDGNYEIDGRFWYYGNYMIINPLEELANDGETVFTLAK